VSLDGLLTTTVTLERKATSKDQSLGAVDSWSAVGSYRATIQPVSAKERYLLQQRNVWMTHKVYFAQNVLATPRDRIRTADGLLYNILAYYDQAGRGRVFMAECKEMT
jgi:SPP1 family predicted phage head-tail adaptor